MFYDHSFVSSTSLFQGRCVQPPYSATHDVVGVVHGVFLLNFSFEVCDFTVQPFQLKGENTVFGLVLVWSSIEEGRRGG